MAHLNHKGPQEKGSGTGRKLGLCNNKELATQNMGQGMGLRRRVSEGGLGQGKRCKSGLKE